uniref:Capsid polyprotein VP90 n=1 Tax=Macaque MLB-like astrovirus TaxID=2796356 RepID=A0A8E0KGJ4_9VIRU|nr:TPA: ORF2 protein [Macaque MLB-like astrovirus]
MIHNILFINILSDAWPAHIKLLVMRTYQGVSLGASWNTFGGVDQMMMADNEPQQRVGKRNKRSRNRAFKNNVRARTKIGKYRNNFNRNRRARKNHATTGPKAAVSQTITATLGSVGSNLSDTVETECAIFLNPVIAKDSGASSTFGPLQSLGAQYALWRLKWLEIRLQPLVGASAVSGTVVRVSLNMTTGPTLNSWSGLGARHHRDVKVGSVLRWRVHQRNISGPCETWWKTNTAEDPSLSLGPAIEVHTYGRTMSTYKNEQFEGGLFLLELTGHWEFANYAASPALATLSSQKDSSQDTKTLAIASEGSNEPIEMLIPTGTWNMKSQYGGNGSIGDAIYQVVDTSVNVITDLFPPPFSWLGKSCWWFIRKVIGKSRTFSVTINGQNQSLVADVYYVYTSASAARDGKPAISSSAHQAKHLSGQVTITQISTDNIMNESTVLGPRGPVEPSQPIGPSSYPMTSASLVLMGGYFRSPMAANFGQYMAYLFRQKNDNRKIEYRLASGSRTKVVFFCYVDYVKWMDKQFNLYTNEPDGVFGDVGNIYINGSNVAKVISMSGTSGTFNNGITFMLCRTTSAIGNFQVSDVEIYVPYLRVFQGTGGKDMDISFQKWEDSSNISFNAMPDNMYFLVATMGGGKFAAKSYTVYNEEFSESFHLNARWAKYISQVFGMSWDSPTYACVTWEPRYLQEPVPSREITWDDDGEESEDEFFGVSPVDALHEIDRDHVKRKSMLQFLMADGMSLEDASGVILRAYPTEELREKRAHYHDLLYDGLDPQSAYSEVCVCK